MITTLTGKRLITVMFDVADDAPATVARKEEVIVRQIPIREYDDGLKHFGDEIALVAFLVGKPRAFALELAPASYEEVLEIGKEINEKGFFAFCRRRIEAEQQQQVQLSAAMASLPEAVRKTILTEGAKAMASTGSPASSLRSPPRPR